MARRTQHGVMLAVDIVSYHFGELVGRFCGILLRHGPLTLQEVARRAEASVAQAKSCLLVLIQHNCAQAFSAPRAPDSDKVVTQYVALFDVILHQLRFARFICIVESDLGPQAASLLEGLLQNGRLTFDQLVQWRISKATKDAPVERENIRLDFCKLVSAHYVEHCPRAEPFLDPLLKEQSAGPRRNTSKSLAKILPLEQQALVAANVPDAERFSFVTYSDAEMLSSSMSNSQSFSGGKRKFEALELDQELNIKIAESEVLWRANYKKFTYCIKKNVLAQSVALKLGADAGIVFEAIIESSGVEEIDDGIPVNAYMNSISKILREKPGGDSMTFEHIRATVDQLRSVGVTEKAPASFNLDISNITSSFKNNEIESLVKARYGAEAYRIFRSLLMGDRPFDTEKISKMTFVEDKVTLQILYKLFTDGFVDVEKSSSAGQGQQQFLWQLKTKVLQEHILDYIFHTALNLKQKIRQIVEQQQEALKDAASQKRQKSILLLQTQLFKLDYSIMFFLDF